MLELTTLSKSSTSTHWLCSSLSASGPPRPFTIYTHTHTSVHGRMSIRTDAETCGRLLRDVLISTEDRIFILLHYKKPKGLLCYLSETSSEVCVVINNSFLTKLNALIVSCPNRKQPVLPSSSAFYILPIGTELSTFDVFVSGFVSRIQSLVHWEKCSEVMLRTTPLSVVIA